MNDIVDDAQKLEQLHNEGSISRVLMVAEAERRRDEAIRRARIAASFEPRDPAIDSLCICGKPIEPERLRTLNTIRCRACAHAHATRWEVR